MTAKAVNKPPRIWQILVKLQNPMMKWLLRSPLHGMVSRMYMLITFTGRKSGKQYVTPVQYRQDENRLYIVTSAGYTWWKNLRGGAPVQVRVRGRYYAGHAETISDPQTIDAVVARIYPSLSAERRARFVPGAVAITIDLQR